MKGLPDRREVILELVSPYCDMKLGVLSFRTVAVAKIQGPDFRLLDVSHLGLLHVADGVLVSAEVTPFAMPFPVEVAALRDFVCGFGGQGGRTFFQRH